ncbi:hypothetical protein JL721_10077 [Aureococcus anophagefferens]|nr:hypothetical protein JL721_10077 [Aureococcus anophagefferens]
MAQRFRGGGGVAGALGGLPPGAGRNPPVDPAAAFAAYNQRGGLPAVPGAAPRAANPPPRPPAEDARKQAPAPREGGAAPEDDDRCRPRRRGASTSARVRPGPIVNRAADVLVSVRRAELELAVQRRTLVELREEIAALREARDRDARNEAPAAAAVYKVAARLSTDERRLEEFANVFKAMADRIKVLERQSEGYLEVGQRRLNALEARLGGVGDVGQLAVAAKRTAEEAANNSVAIELQENHLDGVKADVARVGQGVESSKKLAERVRDEGAKVADNLRTSLSGAEAQARAALTDESSARRDATTIDGVDARVVQEVSDREKAVGEVATDVVRRWDAIHEAERERIDAYQKVATKRFDELERVLSAEIAARRDGASKLAARQVAVEDAARDDLLKSCSKLGARIEDVDHRVGDGLQAMQESALTTAKAVAQPKRDRKTADADAEAAQRSSPRRRSGSRPTESRHSDAKTLARALVEDEAAARVRVAADLRLEAEERRRSRERAAARDAAAYLLHRVADEAQGAKNAALAGDRRDGGPLGRDVGACSRRSMSRDQGLAAALAIEKRDREVSDETIQRERLVSRAVRSTVNHVADDDLQRWKDDEADRRLRADDAGEAAARAWRDKQEKAADADATAAFAWRTNEENWRRRSDDAGEAAARLARQAGAAADAEATATSAWRTNETDLRDRAAAAEAAATLAWRTNEENWRRRSGDAGEAAAPGATGARGGRGGDGDGRLAEQRDGQAGPRRRRGATARGLASERGKLAAGRRRRREAAAQAWRDAQARDGRGGDGERRRIDDEEEERIGADAAARAASEEAFADARARAERRFDRAADRVADEARAATLRTVCDAIATDIAAENDRARAAAALASEARSQRRTRRGPRRRAAAVAARRAASDAALASEAAELQRRRTDDQAALAEAVSTLEDELEDATCGWRQRRGAGGARDALFATDARLGDSLDERASALAGRVDDGRDRDASSSGSETTQENEEKRDALKAELTEALAAESAARTEALASETAARAEALASETAARAELSKEVGLLDATLEERCSGLDHKIDEEIRAAGASSTDALQVLKDEIATTEEVKRAEPSAKLSEDLDGKAALLESKVEDADAKAKALETKLADVEHKLADEASSRAAAVDGCKAAAEAKVAALKSELTDDVSKRVGDVKASLEAEIRDAREKADKAEKSADKAGKEAAKASTFEEPPSDDDGPEKETPPQEEPKKDD